MQLKEGNDLVTQKCARGFQRGGGTQLKASEQGLIQED